MNTTNRTRKIVRERVESNIRVSHPTLVTLGIVIGVSLMAVLMINMIDVIDGIQQAEAMKKLPRVQVDDQCEGTPRGPDKCQR